MRDFGKIECVLLNQDGRPQVYLGRANTLQVQLTNQTGHDLPLTGGPPADPPLPGGPFTVRLDLAELLPDPTAQARLVVTAPGWAARFFADDDYPAWVLSPVASQLWAAQQTLTLTVAGLTPTQKAGTYYVDVEMRNLDGLPPQARKLTLGIVNPPTQQLLREAVTAQLAGDTVFSTKRHAPAVRNELKLTLYNRTDQPLVAEDQPWHSEAPHFVVSVVTATTAPGYYALTTPEALSNVEVSVTGTDWQVETVRGTQVQWRLWPQRHDVLGINQAGLVEITFRNMVTPFQPGPTLLYVQGINVPGYADGFLTLLLRKAYQPMRFEYFRFTDPGDAQPGQPLPPPTLEWKVNQATHVLLSGVGPVPSEGSLLAEPGLFTRSYELTALDTALGHVEERHLSLRADPLLGVPVGGIIAWNGTLADVPVGWLVCDGTNQTPDLRDCFVPGAGNGTATRPHVSVRAPMHSHKFPLPMGSIQVFYAGAHTHSLPTSWHQKNMKGGQAVDKEFYTGFDSGGLLDALFPEVITHTHRCKTTYNDISSLTSLSTAPVPRPAWYALLYLQYRGSAA